MRQPDESGVRRCPLPVVALPLSHAFPLIDLLPWGRQEVWQDSPEGRPQRATYEGWLDSPDIARLYGARRQD